MHHDLYNQSMITEDERLAYIDNASCEQLQLLLIDYFAGDVRKPNNRYRHQDYINRTDEDFQILKTIAEHEGIDIAIAEQEVIVTPEPKKYGRPTKEYQALLDAKAAAKESPTEPTEQSEPAAPAPKKRGRKSNAEKAALVAQEAANNPAPTEKWPFPTPKKGGDES